MLDDSDVRSRRLPNLGTKVAILAAIPFLAYGIFLVIGLGLLYWEPIRLKMKSRLGQKELARG